ncbi:MAG: aminodeoxychorismate/anthranilate synthase component II [Vulcanococcus sp.]|jgi:para-aminobenzoate synthetase component 2|uniref:anthranilate synthase component II n=1 Tax=Vulcanococcus sp. TaxID=2856995 RepID=UPI0025EFF8C2|nr:aminodeoxychorismate/anthranilate synthase component II [Vulcanococcus sp.]MBM5784927.1 aminodeoxychorismate/anthranilate synthase component II [Cyanobacteria bacterium K_DeepCast_35m_m1_288]MBW0172983.1 aminodeoxychorismate/anthranilate synthase component II [Vulcanococcus sp.]MBW0181856.1 aminodeoxychorismate/anthranilate synthase component II [Vulcanococcus sp.]
MLLVLDNYDSFTFNLVQYLGELAADHPITEDLRVERNDALTLEQIRALAPDAILISPGPGDPDQSGVCLEVLRELSPTIPTLGVCLGHQSIAQVYGGKVVRAKELMHGKTSPVLHEGQGVFAGLPNPLTATRYHSLIAERESLPECLEITAWLEDGTIMGLRHREHQHLQGVQFHPESVLTQSGHQLLSNFLAQAAAG